jgi:hypothetical protein
LLKGWGNVEHLGCGSSALGSSACASSALASSARDQTAEGIVVNMLIMLSRAKMQHVHAIYKIPVARIINRIKPDIVSLSDLEPNAAAIALIAKQSL